MDWKLLLHIALIIVYLIIAFPVLKEAVENIKEKEFFGEEFLMAVASLGAIAIGEYYEAIAVMVLYRIGEWLQDLAVDKSRDSISELMDIRPDFANVKNADGTEEKVDPTSVSIGSEIIVKPGEKIPIDGIVLCGDSMVDTSALTGESVPRHVTEGDGIMSGCVNVSGLLTIRTTKEFGESTASKILYLVENAAEKKSHSENFTDRFARIYTPIVCILAVLIAFVPPVFVGGLKSWIYRALTFLVVSCPCSLVISVPLAFFAGLGTASKEGILIKGSNYLEALTGIKTAVFDKTGTLTKGVFEVQDIEAVGNEEMLLEYAAYAEANSTHPIAVSIVKAYGKELDASRIESVTEEAGRGIMAVVSGKKILVGNEKLMNAHNINFVRNDSAGTIVYAAADGAFLGSILISDSIKADAEIAVIGLKENGVDRCVMLTGDNSQAAAYVADKIGISEVHADLLPADKVDFIEDGMLFAGDGVNDAPVLARADVGIAMGGLGSDAAIEAADIVIMDDKPSRIVTALKLAKRTVKLSKECVVFAIAVKVIIMIITAMGWGNMWLAVFADVGVCLLCVLNAMRNMRKVV